METENQFDPQVVLTGAAKEATNAPLGRVDVGSSGTAYLVKVALPGVRHGIGNLKCTIGADGRVCIEGVVGGPRMLNDSKSLGMKAKLLCPTGPFTVSFSLPGPVDPRLASCSFGSDGILEVLVKAKMQ
ncbi:hypothetical protein NMG60_11015952 [Bertholletia excelsa]